MQGFNAGPIKIKFRKQWYTEEVHVASIQQDLLQGFDSLVHRGKSIIDMAKVTLMLMARFLILT